MSVRPYRDIHRRTSRRIMVGGVAVGGDSPISVQSMTNTLTADAAATIEQVRQIAAASAVPIVADIHFHYKRAIESAKAGAACLRINPGNIGSAQRVRDVVN